MLLTVIVQSTSTLTELTLSVLWWLLMTGRETSYRIDVKREFIKLRKEMIKFEEKNEIGISFLSGF